MKNKKDRNRHKVARLGGCQKGGFPKGWFWWMFPWNENRNEGTFGCSPRTKTGNEGTFAKTTLLRNRLFVSRGEIHKMSCLPPSCRSLVYYSLRHCAKPARIVQWRNTAAVMGRLQRSPRKTASPACFRSFVRAEEPP